MDPATKARAINLIKSGLYEANLQELRRLARQHFHSNPTLYGSLIALFVRLIEEFSTANSGQGVDTARLQFVEQALTQPLIDALQAEFDPPAKLLNTLDSLHLAWFAI
jgi:hypothetical protein